MNVKNLVPYDPFFNTIVPAEERATREQLECIITSYFQGLTDHKPIEETTIRVATATTAVIE